VEPVHTVGTQALESEIAAENFGDALRWQAGRGIPVLANSSNSVSNIATPLSANVDFAVILDLVNAKEPLTTESTRA
jgi:hypothetical protein